MVEETFYTPDLMALIPEIAADSIISRTLYGDERLKVVLFGFAAGQELSEHTSAHPAILHFLSGEAAVMLGDESKPAGPGTWIHMPPRLPHSIEAQTPVVMLLLMLKWKA
ncbi:MAG TPA: cupin domain-containing protein [Anaerolineae bacterium]